MLMRDPIGSTTVVEDLGRQLSLGKQTDLILLDFSEVNLGRKTCLCQVCHSKPKKYNTAVFILTLLSHCIIH